MPNRLVLIALAGLAVVLVMLALGQSGPDLGVPTTPGTVVPDVSVTPSAPQPGTGGAPATSTAPPAVSAPSDYISDAAKMLIMLVIALGAGAYLFYNWWKDGRE
jgi:hypothetical protein